MVPRPRRTGTRLTATGAMSRVPRPVRTSIGRPLLTDRSWAILLFTSGPLLGPDTVLSESKLAACSRDDLFGAPQLGQRPIEPRPAQLRRALGTRRVPSRELGLALVGGSLALIGPHVALIGPHLALIGPHVTLTDLRGLHLDSRLPHLKRDLSGIGGGLARRDDRLAERHFPLAPQGPPVLLIQIILVWLRRDRHASQYGPCPGGLSSGPRGHDPPIGISGRFNAVSIESSRHRCHADSPNPHPGGSRLGCPS
ncbi:hypothetical protein KALB_3907 [Kutzneria albida DSM 43870]|uniref:Uncharacterized protein n=1 Tax=Kutzneria albida DSM 43870 TaxID=1449976 RepID=W5W9Q7_9PSEU|nr:hypothetical protein KALB_3907 [Kutzneria albida DSM 43870]